VGVTLTWVGSPRRSRPTALKLAGPALYGSYAVVDFQQGFERRRQGVRRKYEAAYKSAPDIFASWSYDAVHVLARAIGEAKSLEPEKLRQAILAVRVTRAPRHLQFRPERRRAPRLQHRQNNNARCVRQAHRF